MPCRFSAASNSPFMSINRGHITFTANMPSLTRKSRQTISSSCGWPPCEFRNRILRMPARYTLSPSSYQTRPKVSCDKVSVPGKAKCSSDFPTGIIGSTRAGQSGSINSTARAMMPALIAASTLTGKCGPCCSTAPTGRIATTRSASRPAKSCVVRSHHQCDLRTMRNQSPAVLSAGVRAFATIPRTFILRGD